MSRHRLACLFVAALCWIACPVIGADQPATDKPVEQSPTPLNPEKTVLLDKAAGKVIVLGEICLREGALEFLATIKGTKEHEAIIAVDAKAYIIHTGLVALGAKSGKPAIYTQDGGNRPPTGDKIDIHVAWTDKEGKTQRIAAREWIRYLTRRFYTVRDYDLPAGVVVPEKSELRYDRKQRELSWYGPMSEKQRDAALALSKDATYRKHIQSFFDQSQNKGIEAGWVFPGSGFYTDPETGKKFYLAEDGDLICVANFTSAMLDIAMASSSQGTENLLFEAWTERIPPKGTKVRLELTPVKEGDVKDSPKTK
jgi:hypothetical protein